MHAACGRPGLEDRTEPRGSGPSERVWRAGRRQREPGRATPWFARIWPDAHRGGRWAFLSRAECEHHYQCSSMC